MIDLRAVATAACLATIAVPVLAQQPTQAQGNAIRQACRADYQAHCATVPTGGSAALACLQQNAASLSQPCQSALAAVGGGTTGSAAPPSGTARPAAPAQPAYPPIPPREEVAILRQACGRDYQTYCRGVRPGGGRAIACLEAHGSSLSRQCRSALLAARHGG